MFPISDFLDMNAFICLAIIVIAHSSLVYSFIAYFHLPFAIRYLLYYTTSRMKKMIMEIYKAVLTKRKVLGRTQSMVPSSRDLVVSAIKAVVMSENPLEVFRVCHRVSS